MDNAYRLTRPAWGWLRVAWPDSYEHNKTVWRCLEQVVDIPGISLAPRAIDIPANTLVLEPLQRLFEAFSTYVLGERTASPLWLPATPLFEHQTRAAAHALSHRGMLLADSMGLGKTRAAIVAAESWLRDTESGSCLILAPLFTRATWLGELLALGAVSSPEEFCSVESLDFNSPSFRPQARYKFCHYGLVSAWGSRFWMASSTNRPQVAILDECFVAGTQVATPRGWVSIEQLGVGDLVLTLDGTPQPVLAAWSSVPSTLVEVVLDKRCVRCTPNHPFLTHRGWVHAEDLRTGDEVVRAVLRTVLDSTTGRESLLFSRVPQSLGEAPDARAQSDGGDRCKRTRLADVENDWSQAQGPGRKWTTVAGATTASHASAGTGLGQRACDSNSALRPTAVLQDRHCEPGDDGRSGGRRQITQGATSTGRGRTQGPLFGTARVVRVSRVERGRAAPHGDCGLVYNLSVGGSQTFIIDGGLVVHNCHYVKNSRVKRSEASRVVAQQCPMRILLTGTPIENRVAELWHLLTILNGTHSWGSPIAFRRRYAGAYRGQHGWIDTDPTNVDEFQQRLGAAGYLRRTVDDVGLDLPPFNRQTLPVTLKRTDAHAHSDLTRGRDLEALVDAVLERRAGEDTIALLTALRKLTSRAKLAATIEYVSNLLDQGEDVVVFVWERDIATQLQVALQDATDKVVYRVTGEVTPAMRDTTVEHFQAHGGALIATIDALKEGVTLHRARFVVLHDLDWRPTSILQAEKRIHRIGQHRACQSVWVLGVSTVDVVLARCIIAKVKQASVALNIVDGQRAVEELGLEDAVGLESFETKFARLVEEWRAQ